MSVRAYRVNKILEEKVESFNLSHDENIRQYLSDIGRLDSLNSDLGGFLEIEINEFMELITSTELSQEQRKDLLVDLKWAIENKKDFVSYNCY